VPILVAVANAPVGRLWTGVQWGSVSEYISLRVSRSKARGSSAGSPKGPPAAAEGGALLHWSALAGVRPSRKKRRVGRPLSASKRPVLFLDFIGGDTRQSTVFSPAVIREKPRAASGLGRARARFVTAAVARSKTDSPSTRLSSLAVPIRHRSPR